jgi:hypothetical protein
MIGQMTVEVTVQNTTKAFMADEFTISARLFTGIGSFFNELELWREHCSLLFYFLTSINSDCSIHGQI